MDSWAVENGLLAMAPDGREGRINATNDELRSIRNGEQLSVGIISSEGDESRHYFKDLSTTPNSGLIMVVSELEDVRRAATRLANAIKDINNIIGDIPEVKKMFSSVARDVEEYEGLKE